MQKNYRLLIVALTLFLILGVSASGQSSKETRNVSGFSEIGFGISGHLYVEIGSRFSVVLEGDSKSISKIETYVKNDKLIITMENFRVFNIGNVDCYVTLPSLKGLDVSGSGKAEIRSALNSDILRLSVSGSGNLITGDLEADSFYCTISGSGSVLVGGKGSADNGNITISGSGGYEGDNFEIDKLTVNISGSGKSSCKAGDELNANISGSGNVWYSGSPKINARSSGSGHVRPK